MTAANVEPPRRPAGTRSHAVYRFLGRLHEVLDAVSTDTAWALSPEELAQCLEEAFAAQARLAELTLALVAQAEASDLASHDGRVNLVAWLRERVRLAPAEGKRQVRLARALATQPVTREALAAGGFPTTSTRSSTPTAPRRTHRPHQRRPDLPQTPHPRRPPRLHRGATPTRPNPDPPTMLSRSRSLPGHRFARVADRIWR